MKRSKKVFQKHGYLVDERNQGVFNENTRAIVMDNTLSRDPKTLNKKKINYKRTENEALWTGQNTVALFKIKRHAAQ